MMEGIEPMVMEKLARNIKMTEAVVAGYKERMNTHVKGKGIADWRDRTGKARQNLHATYDKIGRNKWRLGVHHGMTYGIYLELGTRKMRSYPALGRTIGHMYPQLKADLRKLWEEW